MALHVRLLWPDLPQAPQTRPDGASGMGTGEARTVLEGGPTCCARSMRAVRLLALGLSGRLKFSGIVLPVMAQWCFQCPPVP